MRPTLRARHALLFSPLFVTLGCNQTLPPAQTDPTAEEPPAVRDVADAPDDVEVATGALTTTLPNFSGDPQLFGFGFPQLAILDASRLQVLAGPVRQQDSAWTTRFTTPLGASKPDAVVAGDFWHDTAAPDKKAFLLAVRGTTVTVHDPVEVPGTRTWATLGGAQSLPGLPTTGVLDFAAGDVLGQNRDQLLALTATRVFIYTAPSSPGGAWVLAADTAAPKTATGMAAGEFNSGTSSSTEDRYRANWIRDWDEPNLYAQGIGRGPRGKDELCLLGSDGHLTFHKYDAATKTWPLLRTDTRTVSGKLGAGDFLKRGREAVAVVGTNIALYESPTGTSGQSTLLLTGTFDTAPTQVFDVTADRLFGYVDKTVEQWNRRGTVNPANGTAGKGDLEVAFVERTPRYGRNAADGHYGWPAKNEVVTYKVYVKNNAAVPVAANVATVRLWLNKAARNADVLTPTPDQTITINQTVQPFNPSTPNYFVATATFAWPYGLITQNGNPQKKLDLPGVGERWVIASVDFANDFNRRNDRYEVALHAWLLHPVMRGAPSLADTQPTIGGDPYSKEYSIRKLADALTLRWARSHAGDKTGADLRVAFDGYLYQPDDANPDYIDRWNLWDAPRDLDGWFGWNWEIFNMGADSDELHETGHLVHQLGDLYQYFIEPSRIGAAKMADGRAVQLNTYVWGHDGYSDNSAILGEPATRIHQHVVGMRNVGHEQWWTIAPAKVNVKVVDRDGTAIPNANIKLWADDQVLPLASGVTDASGVWYTGYPKGTPWYDAYFNEPHYDPLPQGMYVTVEIGGLTDAAELGSDSRWAHGRYTLCARYHENASAYTWTFKTSYKASVPAFTRAVDLTVEGTTAKIAVNAAGKFNLYRKLPPAYGKVFQGSVTSTGVGTFTNDFGARDAFGRGRDSAIYEVTEVVNNVEGLPKQLTVHAIAQNIGITDLGAGKLLVGNKPSGASSTFVSMFDDTTPTREYLYHFRWGHIASKAVPSSTASERFYVTLNTTDEYWENDLGWGEHRVEVYAPAAIAAYGPAHNEDVIYEADADSITSAQVVKNGVTLESLGVNAGDRIELQGREVIINAISGGTMTVSGFDPAGERHFYIRRHAGAPGTTLAKRQLQSARGLATLKDSAAAEHVAIADPVGARVVLWDARTKYKTSYTTAGLFATGLASHPTTTNRIFALDRNANVIRLLQYASNALTQVASYPLGTTVGKSDSAEIGLAATASGTDVLLAVTDAASKRVLEYKLTSGGTFTAVATYTQGLPPVFSSAALERPLDVAYSTVAGARRLYVTDKLARVMRLY